MTEKKSFFRYAAVFAAVYFFSLNGLAALPNLTIQFLLKNQLKLRAEQMAYFQAVTLLAWVVKPIWGILCDSFPVFGSRRKFYLVASSTVAAVCWIVLARNPSSLGLLLAAITVCYLAYAFQDVVTDALMIETGKPFNWTGQFQAVQWGAVYIAMIATGLAGGMISDLAQQGTLPYRKVFAATALFPIATILIASVFIKEERGGVVEMEAGAEVKGLWKDKKLWLLAFFLFFWNFSPSFGAPFFYYAVDTLKLSGTFLGILQGVTSAAMLLGTFFYGRFIARVPMRPFLLFSVFAGVAVILSHYIYFLPAVVANAAALKPFFLATGFLFGFFNTLIFLTLLNLAAKVSPRFAGGTAFALLMSFYNLGQLGSSAAGGYLYPIVGFQWLIAISAACSLAVLFFMPFLPIAERLTSFEERVKRLFRRA